MLMELEAEQTAYPVGPGRQITGGVVRRKKGQAFAFAVSSLEAQDAALLRVSSSSSSQELGQKGAFAPK